MSPDERALHWSFVWSTAGEYFAELSLWAMRRKDFELSRLYDERSKRCQQRAEEARARAQQIVKAAQ